VYNDRTNGRLLGMLRTGANQRPQFFDPRQQAAVEPDLPRFAGFRST
jgi:hypothetical protein